MIVLSNVSKSFNKQVALEGINCEIKRGSVLGIIGSNGSGKSTLLRLISGIYRPDTGDIVFEGEKLYENTAAKSRMFYISDDQYQFSGATMLDMAKFYDQIYGVFDWGYFENLANQFKLDTRRKLNTFSKGMQRQAHIILALATKPEVLLCDETFDGLDPVVRQGIKGILLDMVKEREMTVIIASHNLRELEDLCDYISLLHQSSLILSKALDDIQSNVFKVQCAFSEEMPNQAFAPLSPLYIERFGRMAFLTIRGDREAVAQKMENLNPLYYELMPLSLEEIFIVEMEVLGYDVKSFIL